MAWIRVSDAVPAEGEQVLIYDSRNSRLEAGRRVGARWFVEDLRDGRLTEVEDVTHWAPVLDSEAYDPADD